jgi:hypothetical protein
MKEMKDMENYFLIFIGILVVCLMISAIFFNKGKFGYKKHSNGLGFNWCEKVYESPNKKTNVYSNLMDCSEAAGIQSYKCNRNNDLTKCDAQWLPPNHKYGYYSTKEECDKNCNA